MAENKDMNNISLEEGFEKIDELLAQMQNSDISLEESFEKYKYGMELVKHCHDQIEKVETQLKILSVEDIAEDE